MHRARFPRQLSLVCLTLFWGCGESSGDSATPRAVSGQVRDAQSGAAIAQASVELTSDALDHAEATTDGDGRFAIDLEVSEGVVFGHVTARHRDYEQAAATSVYFDGEENVIEIELRRKPAK